MFETKAIWFLSAAVLAGFTGLAAFKDAVPSAYQLIVIGVGALAQGLLAWRAFVQSPPNNY